jgi:hypothetical protein
MRCVSERSAPSSLATHYLRRIVISLSTTHYSLPTFLPSLFSDSYELPFPPARRTLGGQLLCFDNHPHRPGVWGSLCSFSPLATSPLFSYSYKPLLPQLPCFHIHTKPPGCHHPSLAPRTSSPLCSLCLCGKSHFFSNLPPLCAPKKVNSFAIKQIQPLFRKHPGYGGHSD